MYIINDDFINRNARIDENAGADYLYGHNEKIENALFKYEKRWAPIIRKIIDTEEIKLSDIERKLILNFFWLSESRTKYQTDYTKKHIRDLANIIDGTQIYFDNEDDISDEFVVFETYLEDADAIAEVSNDLKLVLIKNNTTQNFITSDCPMVKYNSLFLDNKYIISYNYGQKGYQSFFPISPKLCLLLFDRNTYKLKKINNDIVIINNKSDIENLNKLFIYNADDRLFFYNIDINIVKKILAQKKEAFKNDFTEPFYKEGRSYIPFNTPGVYKKVNFSFFAIKDKYRNIKLEYSVDGPLREKVREILRKRNSE